MPKEWGRAMYRRGATLSMLGKAFGPDEALERSVESYRAALEVQATYDEPGRVAATNWGLGHVLIVLGDRKKDASLFPQASAALEAALPFYPKSDVPSIGRSSTAISAMPTTIRGPADPAYYAKAAAAYQASLDIYAGQPDRTLWAQYQGELGNALLMIGGAANGDDATLAKAVAAYEAALTVITRENNADDWARNQINLASALTTLGYRMNDNRMIRRSAEIYRAVLDVRTRERMPEQWASTQDSLARVLSMLADREPDAAATDAAVAANRALADFVGRDRDPARWAIVQNEVGYALTVAGKREKNPARFEEAVPILRDAVALQHQLNDVPAVAFTEDSLCDVLTELGAARKDTALDRRGDRRLQERHRRVQG